MKGSFMDSKAPKALIPQFSIPQFSIPKRTMGTRMFKLSLILSFIGLGSACKTNSEEGSHSLSDPRGLIQKSLVNYNGSIECASGSFVMLEKIEDLPQIIKFAAETHKSLRIVSSATPHSYSQVICPTDGGMVVDMQKFNRIITLDGNASSPSVTVEPGVKLVDLQEYLHKQGYGFPVSPDYNDVSMAGAVATGAHHSSLKISSAVSDWLMELTLINGLGQRVVLTGAQLDTARVHLGLLGAVVSMKFKIVPQFKLSFKVERFPDDHIGTKLAEQVAQFDYARASWFPHTDEYILESFDGVSVDTPGESFGTAWTSTPDISILGDLPSQVLNKSKFASCTAATLRAKTFGGFFKVIDSPKNNPVGFSHEMMAGNCRTSKCPWQIGIKARTMEAALDLKDFPGWSEDVKKILDQRQACFINGIYLRFSKASASALGQASGQDVVMFEIHIAQNNKPSLEKWSDVYDEILQMTLKKYKGRPHWGKNSTPYFTDLGPATFPKWKEFENLRQKHDPKMLFTSDLWSAMAQYSSSKPPLLKEGCALTQSCICEIDSHCGQGARCVSGGYFQDARVCRK